MGDPKAKGTLRAIDSTNLVVLGGELADKPHFGSLQGSGLAVCNFEIRTTEDIGGGRERLHLHPCVAYGGAAETLRFAQAGARVFVRGSLRWRNWHQANGASRRIYETVIYHAQLLGEVQSSGEFSTEEQRT